MIKMTRHILEEKRRKGFIVSHLVFCKLTALAWEWHNDDDERREAKGSACWKALMLVKAQAV